MYKKEIERSLDARGMKEQREVHGAHHDKGNGETDLCGKEHAKRPEDAPKRHSQVCQRETEALRGERQGLD